MNGGGARLLVDDVALVEHVTLRPARAEHEADDKPTGPAPAMIILPPWPFATGLQAVTFSSLGSTSLMAPRQPEWVMSKTTPFGSLYLTS